MDARVKEVLEFCNDYKHASNAATGAKYDPNANVTCQNLCTMQAEAVKKLGIDVQRAVALHYITQDYGEEVANQYIDDLKKHIIYVHDESNIAGYPYCCSISLYPFLLNGLKDLGGSSLPPKHANSYIGGLINLVFLISAQFAGALALPEALVYLDYFLRKDYGQDYTKHLDEEVNTKSHETIRHIIEDLFQQFVYSINQPAGSRNYQSPFINIAYYDKGYFQAIFKDFVFPDGEEPCWETTKVLQKMFMKWFNKERTKSILTFPVETANALYSKETKQYKDPEFADLLAEMWVEGHSFFCYNSDSADALSSCCFSKNTEIIIKSGQLIETNTFENLYAKYKDKKIEALYKGEWKTAHFIKLANRPMYKIVLTNDKYIICSDNHLNLTSRGDVATTDLTLEDSLCYTQDIYAKDYEFVKIKSIEPYKYIDDIFCLEMDDQTKPYFTLFNGVITHNCRLKNAIEENTFSYTLGAGGIQTGSKRVITMNLNRIIQDWSNEKEYRPLSEKIKEITSRMHKYLKAWNHKLWDDYNAGMLPVYKAGFIDLDKQYLTIGM